MITLGAMTNQKANRLTEVDVTSIHVITAINVQASDSANLSSNRIIHHHQTQNPHTIQTLPYQSEPGQRRAMHQRCQHQTGLLHLVDLASTHILG